MSSYRKILYQVDAAIARITLNRPDKRNALDAELLSELKDALRQSAESQARVVVLAGAGRDFCAGADLAGLQQTQDAGITEIMGEARRVAELFLQMRRHPCPIIASVRGRALAGGCGLATACDIILASESAQFGYPEVNIGFIPAMVMAILRRSVSEKKAFELITSAEIISAPAALQAGMVNRLFPDERLESEVDAYARNLAAKSASALSLSKNLLYHMDAMTFESALEAGVQANAIARMTEDCRRGIARFLKKE